MIVIYSVNPFMVSALALIGYLHRLYAKLNVFLLCDICSALYNSLLAVGCYVCVVTIRCLACIFCGFVWWCSIVHCVSQPAISNNTL